MGLDLIFSFVQNIVDFFLTGETQKQAIAKARELQNANINAFLERNQLIEDAYGEVIIENFEQKAEQTKELEVKKGNLITVGIVTAILVLLVFIVFLFTKLKK